VGSKGFHQIGHDVLVQGTANEVDVGVGGDGHSGHDPLLIDAPQRLEAIDARQMDVHDDDVGRRCQHGLYHVGPGLGLGQDFMTELLDEDLLEQLANCGVVINDHDLRPWLRCRGRHCVTPSRGEQAS
jgi:hypothetical protein